MSVWLTVGLHEGKSHQTLKWLCLSTGSVIEYDLPNLSQRFAVLSLNPWSADVVNSITTPGMNEYTWHGDIFQINICLLEKTLLSLELQQD